MKNGSNRRKKKPASLYNKKRTSKNVMFRINNLPSLSLYRSLSSDCLLLYSTFLFPAIFPLSLSSSFALSLASIVFFLFGFCIGKCGTSSCHLYVHVVLKEWFSLRNNQLRKHNHNRVHHFYMMRQSNSTIFIEQFFFSFQMFFFSLLFSFHFFFASNVFLCCIDMTFCSGF